MMSPAQGFKRVLDVLNQLDVPYMIAGSLASCIHGIPRSTRDVDIVAAIEGGHVAALTAALQGEFYADPGMMKQAIREGRMFNLIHHASGFKFDIYPLSAEPYHQAEFTRRKMCDYSFDGQETLRFWVASPEDVILTKLAWYRAGNQVSERQWSDVIDVARVQGGLLDLAYLRTWAASLGVSDLLEEALRQ